MLRGKKIIAAANSVSTDLSGKKLALAIEEVSRLKSEIKRMEKELRKAQQCKEQASNTVSEKEEM